MSLRDVIDQMCCGLIIIWTGRSQTRKLKAEVPCLRACRRHAERKRAPLYISRGLFISHSLRSEVHWRERSLENAKKNEITHVPFSSLGPT